MTDLIRQDLDPALLDEHEGNPNKMGARAFDLLVDNIQRTGLTEAVVVRALDNGRYRIVSGHHRFKAAQYLGFEKVPCTIITDPDFDDEAELFQLVRMNAIKGKLDPQLFMDQYQKVAGKYGDEILQDMFGFSDETEFKKLITATAKSLPKELQDKFKEAAKEVKTIDQLAVLLNQMFTLHGDTLPYGYMVVTYGKQHSVWLQVEKKTFDAVCLIGDLCKETETTMDDVFGGILKKIAAGDLSEAMQDVIDKAPKIVMPTGMMLNPTKENIASTESFK